MRDVDGGDRRVGRATGTQQPRCLDEMRDVADMAGDADAQQSRCPDEMRGDAQSGCQDGVEIAAESGQSGLHPHDPDPEAGPELIPQTVHHGPHRRPSVREVEEHNVTHTPAKSWCPTCVAAKATADPHRRRRAEDVDDEAQGEVAKVYFDYGFFRGRVGDTQVPFLVLTCKRTGMKKAMVTQDRTGQLPRTV